MKYAASLLGKSTPEVRLPLVAGERPRRRRRCAAPCAPPASSTDALMALRGDERYVAQNRRARHDYLIEDTLEAGIQLVGSEVKVLRQGLASIAEAYADRARRRDLSRSTRNFPIYPAARFNHEPRRPRKLLLRRREINRLIGAVKREGMTLVPLAIYFNERGRAKLELGLAKGKRKADKREAEKARDWQRDRARLMRERG